MKPAVREEIVLALEKAFQQAGAADYESGVAQATRFIEFMQTGLQCIQTRDALRKTLEKLEPMSVREEKLALLFLKLMPQLMRYGLKLAARSAEHTLPALPGGRPRASTSHTAAELIQFIRELRRNETPLKVAKNRAKQKFGISIRTVERIWSKRDSVQTDDPSVHELISFISSQATESQEQ